MYYVFTLNLLLFHLTLAAIFTPIRCNGKDCSDFDGNYDVV